MKKIVSLAAVFALVFLVAGPAFAAQPIQDDDPLNRYSVWTKWYDENGNRIHEAVVQGNMDRGQARTVSTGSLVQERMKSQGKQFDFIKETKTYDYGLDEQYDPPGVLKSAS